MTISSEKRKPARPVDSIDSPTGIVNLEAMRYHTHSGVNDFVPEKGIVPLRPMMQPVAHRGVLGYGQAFLDQLSLVVATHLDNPEFSVDMLAKGVNLNRTHLHRKLKSIISMTPTTFIQTIRLTRAAALLAEGNHNVTQAAYTVGFGHLSYFARLFQSHYGVLPSQYVKLTTKRKIPIGPFT